MKTRNCPCMAAVALVVVALALPVAGSKLKVRGFALDGPGIPKLQALDGPGIPKLQALDGPGIPKSIS